MASLVYEFLESRVVFWTIIEINLASKNTLNISSKYKPKASYSDFTLNNYVFLCRSMERKVSDRMIMKLKSDNSLQNNSCKRYSKLFFVIYYWGIGSSRNIEGLGDTFTG